jgi:hypothetical protein
MDRILKPLSGALVFILLSTIGAPAFADDNQPDSAQDVLESMQSRRVRSGYISSAIGASILIVPQFSSSTDNTSKLFFSLAGVTVLAGGLKSLLVRSESERLLALMEELRQSGQLSNAAENQLLVEIAAWSRSERYWNAGISMVGGTVSIISGTTVTDTFLKNFAVVLGGLSVLSGTISLMRPSKIEKMESEKVSWDLSPTVLTAKNPVPGMAVSLNF